MPLTGTSPPSAKGEHRPPPLTATPARPRNTGHTPHGARHGAPPGRLPDHGHGTVGQSGPRLVRQARRSTRPSGGCHSRTPIFSSLHVEKHSDTLREEVLCTVVDILGEEDGVASLESDRAANGLQQRLLR